MKPLTQWIKDKTAGLEDVGTIPIECAGICWGKEADYKKHHPVNDFRVVDLREARQAGTEAYAIWQSAAFTDGACLLEWKNGRNPRYTPLGKFAEHGFDGTLPKGEAFVRMLAEFAKIEGCDWALHMIAALQMGNFISPDGEEWSL